MNVRVFDGRVRSTRVLNILIGNSDNEANESPATLICMQESPTFNEDLHWQGVNRDEEDYPPIPASITGKV